MLDAILRKMVAYTREHGKRPTKIIIGANVNRSLTRAFAHCDELPRRLAGAEFCPGDPSKVGPDDVVME